MNDTDRSMGVGDPELIDRSPVAVCSRRVTGRFLVDEWGLDSDLAALVGQLPQVRWGIRVHDAGRIPDGPALVVYNRHAFAADWLVVAAGLGRASSRAVRFTGIPDVAPVVGVARRLGGVSTDPADLRGLFRSGNLVAVGLGGSLPMVGSVPFAGSMSMAGGSDAVPTWALEAALATGTPVVPVGVSRRGLSVLRPSLHVGEPIATRRRRSARALDEVADLVRERVDELC